MSTRKNLNYVSRACDFCKGRHKKCDGGRPCFACKQRNRTCVYSKKVKKRGPKPKLANNKPKKLKNRPDTDEDSVVDNIDTTSCQTEIFYCEDTITDKADVTNFQQEEVYDALVVEKPETYHEQYKHEEYPVIPEFESEIASVPRLTEFQNVAPSTLETISNNASTPQNRFTQMICSELMKKRSRGLTGKEKELSPQFALESFLKIINWYPLSSIFAHFHISRAAEYWRIATTSVEDKKESEAITAFFWNAVFSHGCRLAGFENEALEFSNRAFIIMNEISWKLSLLAKGDVERLINGVVLFVPFALASQYTSRARMALIHAVSLCNTHRDTLPPALIFRVFTHLVEISTDNSTRKKWFESALSLGPSSATLENRVLMCHVLVFSSGTTEKLRWNHDDSFCCDCDTFFRETDVSIRYWISNVLFCNSKYDNEQLEAFRAIVSACLCIFHAHTASVSARNSLSCSGPTPSTALLSAGSLSSSLPSLPSIGTVNPFNGFNTFTMGIGHPSILSTSSPPSYIDYKNESVENNCNSSTNNNTSNTSGNNKIANKHARRAISLAVACSEPCVPLFVALSYVVKYLAETKQSTLFMNGLRVLQSVSREIPHFRDFFTDSSLGVSVDSYHNTSSYHQMYDNSYDDRASGSNDSAYQTDDSSCQYQDSYYDFSSSSSSSSQYSSSSPNTSPSTSTTSPYYTSSPAVFLASSTSGQDTYYYYDNYGYLLIEENLHSLSPHSLMESVTPTLRSICELSCSLSLPPSPLQTPLSPNQTQSSILTKSNTECTAAYTEKYQQPQQQWYQSQTPYTQKFSSTFSNSLTLNDITPSSPSSAVDFALFGMEHFINELSL